MGVLGLWRLLDPTGKPVPVETLEGKVLAIDISIWIHQVLQGYQDRRGDSVPNAHLLGLFHRICKLLYFKIKPVFVFDGGVPMLKKNTIVSRRKQKSVAVSKAQKLKNDLISNLIKQVAVKDVLDKRNSQGEISPLKETSRILTKSSSVTDMYKLSEQPSTSKAQPGDFDFDHVSDHDSSEESSPRKQSKWIGNIHSVNVNSHEFKSLPADVRYDILTDLKETRKQNSWGRIHEMPQVLNDFSSFQMQRLLKRRTVQESLEVAEKEMGGKTLTLEELDTLLTELGVNTSERDDSAYRIASDSTTRVIFVNDKTSQEEKVISNGAKVSDSDAESNSNGASIPLRRDSTSCAGSDDEVSFLHNIHEYDLDDEDWDFPEVELATPQAKSKKTVRSNSTMDTVMKYMLEYSSLPQEQILALLEQNKKNKSTKSLKRKKEKVSKKSRKEKANDRNKQIEEEDLKHADVPERKESVDSSSDSDFIEIPNVSLDEKPPSLEISETVDEEVKVSEVPEIKSESSDSDSDFITIEDVPIPEATFTPEKKEKTSFEVIVKPDKILEEDLFADVFAIERAETPRIVGAENVEDKVNHACRNLNFQNFENNITNILPDEEGDKVEPSKVESPISVNKYSTNPSDNITSQESIETSEITSSIEGSQSSSQDSKSVPLPISEKDLLSTKDKLQDEQRELSGNIGKLERQAMDVTDQMRSEAQELLRLFGIPYVIAPMEAEAQCAYLEQINLTDGTITDDSDIWLFGGKCVYKNFFNNNKRVLQFRSCDIEHNLKLAREQMIQLALLVGSDYTSGLPGIGPVTAMEILAAFPSEGDDALRGLINFSAWVKSGKIPGPGRTSLRNKLKNVQILKGFPSQAVVQAYLKPTLDESNEKFTWVKPNLTLLSDYVRHKFGWTKLKFEEVINPVVKKLTEGTSQKSISEYFKVQIVPKFTDKNLSKRVLTAVKRLGCEAIEEVPEKEDKDRKKKMKTVKGKSNQKKEKAVENVSQGKEINQNLGENEMIYENPLMDQIVNPSNVEDDLISPQKPYSSEKNISLSRSSEEFIPQREKKKANALKNKMRAIEVFNNSKKKTSRAKKARRPPRKELKEADLSESSSSS
ncbi:DNA repair protein complementing XP-G cells homolog isoform X1 [Belonocnema kinseyi]|uniref:DNA repair protein complementing XP-G cells homolog isoform X1 n=1 Tax=Belonocnema kinseyi TaxID=2817044 RepID=UPI00143DC713|nr:DNA repair protein complementing XP-G cells homolog isoform X1 [Belonocnema kinseyi]